MFFSVFSMFIFSIMPLSTVSFSLPPANFSNFSRRFCRIFGNVGLKSVVWEQRSLFSSSWKPSSRSALLAFCVSGSNVFNELFEAYFVCVVQPGGTLPVPAWPGIFFGMALFFEYPRPSTASQHAANGILEQKGGSGIRITVL